jgi:hypothetical protein
MPALQQFYHSLLSDLLKVRNDLGVIAAMPGFFRDRISLQRAEEETKRLLDTRDERFLGLLHAGIYNRPDSAYLRLLKHAGCEFSDLQSHVRRHGLETTLVRLANEGVYLTSDEFKGKKEVVRRGLSFRVSPGVFARKDSSAGLTVQSSGTRNAPVSTFSPLDWRTLRIMGTAITYDAHEVFMSAYAVYQPMLAGRIGPVLARGKIGITTERWFAPKVALDSRLEEKYLYLITYLTLTAANWFGPGIAKPEFLRLGDVRPIVEWALQNRRDGKKCCIRSVYSNAVRIARCALDMGVTLEGTTFDGGGEPLTDSKRRIIQQVGARVLTHYAFGGNISAGLGCANPAFTDEVHVHQSLLALVEHPRALDGASPSIFPLLGTTLHPAAPRLLLNVENGDYATTVRRDCGCALEKIGFRQHLHTIRSFEKFTSEGMNYSATELFDLLEDTIPSEFGGGPGDYQLVEEEDDDGRTRLTLLVDPSVGAIDEQKLLSRLQQGLAHGSRNNRFMSKFWQGAGTFRLRREAPHASARGKILPLHISR